ncbi:MAG: hypothetical protein IJY23_06390 [Clostridia bacterium]|nr:hypothetical protein [Clostridia bacterium]
MSEIHENLIEITNYELLGKLPNPFIFDDGKEMVSPVEWPRRRKEIYKSAIELQYGTLPPEPEFLEVEPLCLGGVGLPLNSYRIKTGTRANPVIFTMYVWKGAAFGAPAVVSGDLCFKYPFDLNYIKTFLDNGISFVAFNRTEIAPDVAGYNLNRIAKGTREHELGSEVYKSLCEKDCGGQLKAAYPEYSFGAIGAWAWGYSRCVDALEILGFTNMNAIAFTGHSRGGKTAALAGAVDERAAIVNPNASCCGGYSCYRINIEAKTESGTIEKSEDLAHIFRIFPAWMGPDMKEYIGREAELPFDAHYLKALVAPRVLFVSEAASDIMADPVGSWQTTIAASEVYKFLGCEENLIWYYRSGGHNHSYEDISQLVNVIKHVTEGEPLNDKYFKTPFKKMPLAFDWKAPSSN